MCGHNVRVALDDHGLLLLRNLFACEVESVEHLALLIERCLWRVQILRAFIIVTKLAGTETNDITRQIADRPHESAAEAVVKTTLSAADSEPRLNDQIITKSFGTKMSDQHIPANRRVADSEVASRITIKATLS